MVPCAELQTPTTTTTTTTSIAVGIRGRRIRVQLSWQPEMPSVMCVLIHILQLRHCFNSINFSQPDRPPVKIQECQHVFDKEGGVKRSTSLKFEIQMYSVQTDVDQVYHKFKIQSAKPETFSSEQTCSLHSHNL